MIRSKGILINELHDRGTYEHQALAFFLKLFIIQHYDWSPLKNTDIYFLYTTRNDPTQTTLESKKTTLKQWHPKKGKQQHPGCWQKEQQTWDHDDHYHVHDVRHHDVRHHGHHGYHHEQPFRWSVAQSQWQPFPCVACQRPFWQTCSPFMQISISLRQKW